MNNPNLKFLRNISWHEVFENWKAREAADPGWIECATKVKGWPNWEAWREASVSLFGAKHRAWKLHEITNQNKEIPHFQVGPYGGWQAHFVEETKNVRTFAELAELKKDWVNQHGKIQSLVKNFPQPTEMIGIFLPEKNRIVVIEGTHRCAAVAHAVAENKPIHFKKNLTIALTEFQPGEERLLDVMLFRGTAFNGS